MLVNLLFNIAIPAIILSRFSGDAHLGPEWGIVVALAFPISYGVMDYFRASKVNFFSALGVFSVFMTGGISLLELDPKYIAYKEAGIPLLLGLAVIGSLKTPWPLIRTFLYSDLILDIERIEQALKEHDTQTAFERTLALQDDGKLFAAGPFPAVDSAEPGDTGFTGSLIVAEFSSLEAAQSWANDDPYLSNGTYEHSAISSAAQSEARAALASTQIMQVTQELERAGIEIEMVDITSDDGLATIQTPRIIGNLSTLGRQNRELLERSQLLQNELDLRVAEIDRLKESEVKAFFLYGAGAVIAGAFLAIILPRLKPRRSQSEWG
eukprot:g4443.t1